MSSADWISIDEAEELVGRARRTIYRWVRDGKVRTMRPRVHRYFNRADLIATERDTLGRGVR